jgi:hypothetical protein
VAGPTDATQIREMPDYQKPYLYENKVQNKVSTKENVSTGRLLIIVRHSESCSNIEHVRFLFHFPRITIDADERVAAPEAEGIVDGWTETRDVVSRSASLVASTESHPATRSG